MGSRRNSVRRGWGQGSLFLDSPQKGKGGKLKNHKQRGYPGTPVCRVCRRPATKCGNKLSPLRPTAEWNTCQAVNCLHCNITGRCGHCRRLLPLPS